MWALVPDERYVSDPSKSKGKHTRGTAVDVTLVDRIGNELMMPSTYDDFSQRAHRYSTSSTDEERRNSLKLEAVMRKHNFVPFPFEWWHFDFEGWENYPPLDVSFESLGSRSAHDHACSLRVDFSFAHRRGARVRGSPCLTTPCDPIFSDSLFQMAKRQFEIIADHLGIAEGDRERIIYPKRAVSVALPIHRDDGTVDVFHGYRVQHHLAIGPTKGGTRFSPQLTIGESAALAVWMSWKCALAGFLTAEPRAECASIRSDCPGTNSSSFPAAISGDDPIHRPANGHPRARHGDE